MRYNYFVMVVSEESSQKDVEVDPTRFRLGLCTLLNDKFISKIRFNPGGFENEISRED